MRASIASALGVLAVASSTHAHRATANGRIAFDRTVDGNTDIYSVEPDGSDLLRLTDDPAPELAPAWSPDGTKIAYLKLDPGEEQYSLWVMNADGSDQHVIVEGQVGRYLPRTPIAPPDPLVSEFSRPNAVSWSPDGTTILYSRARPPFLIPPGEEDPGGTDESYAGELHLIDADGTNDRDFPCTDSLCDRNEQIGRFSPDGSRISMSGDDDCPDCAGGRWVLIVDADGSNAALFPEDPFSLPWFATDVTWAPDGDTIAFVKRQGPSYTLMSADLATMRLRTLYDAGDTPVAWPEYSPDGKRIVFEQDGQLYFVGRHGGHRTLFLEGSHPDWQRLTP